MDSIQNMNKALAYIESNLDDEIDFQLVARNACCSEHQFNRLFSFLAGIGLAGYIRKQSKAVSR